MGGYKDTKISIGDLGLLFGFSLFETLLVNEAGEVFLFERHIDRLFDSMHLLGFDIKLNKSDLRMMAEEYKE